MRRKKSTHKYNACSGRDVLICHPLQALAIVLVAVFVIQAMFNMFQDWSSSRVMSSIKNMLPEDSMVIRNGVQASLPAQELVPGDIVCIKAGNKLPADMRFLQVSSDAKFDRAILTGESAPLAATVNSTDDNYLETRCIGLQGTHCASGSCTGLVVATGDRTVFGRIAALTNEPKVKMTPLEREVLYFVTIICSIMFAMIAIVLIVWFVPTAQHITSQGISTNSSQGRVAENIPSRLDQRSNTHRRLRQRSHRFHP